MVSISSFYTVFNGLIHNFIFITYNKFIKIIYNKKSVIISQDNFIKNKTLFQIYFLSLICTENTNNVEVHLYLTGEIQYTEYIYGTMAKHYNIITNSFNDNYSFNPLTKNYLKNPLKSSEPKMETSMKKQNKLFKNIKYDLYGFDPASVINEIFL